MCKSALPKKAESAACGGDFLTHRRNVGTPCLPLGADSPYQGEMSRRDKEGRDRWREAPDEEETESF